MTKIMAISLVPVLMVVGFLAHQETPRPSQDAKSVAIDATPPVKNNESAKDLQRRRTAVLLQASRDKERENRIWRRERAEARAEARAERRAAIAEREAEAEAATRAGTRSGSSTLPDLLLLIREHESGGNYQAYNPSGCIGGCYGAYQMTAEYMDDWAREAGYPDYAYVGFWPAEIQDAVALYKFNQTSGALWCDWTDYC
jgi:hypothetical protein